MPLYAYRCTQCGHRFEKIQNFSAEPELECPKCGGVLERPLTAPRLHFKGAGWYVNDYAAKGSEPPASESGAEPAKPGAAAEKPATAATGDSASGTSSSMPAASSAADTPASTPASTTSGSTS